MADELGIQLGAWQRLRDYYHEIRIEMRRVAWPGKQEVYGTTVMVLITTFAFALFFWICDQTFSRLVSRVLTYFLHRA
ncbi:MAG: preprotein translocase subunit SecE [Terriglobia bacterium]